MAGSQIPIYANQIEAQRIGFQAISLTHYDDTAEPQIAAGSVVEIVGALFEFTALESITGWGGIAVSSDVYIKLTVGGASVTAGFTTVAPTWDTAKQGWYSGAERYIAFLRKDGSGNYTLKRLFFGPMRDLGLIKTPMIADGAIIGAKLSTIFDSGGSWTVASGASQVIPAGLYIATGSSANDGVKLEIYQGGSWRGYRVFDGGLILSDGTNVRITGNPSTGGTVHYLKLA